MTPQPAAIQRESHLVDWADRWLARHGFAADPILVWLCLLSGRLACWRVAWATVFGAPDPDAVDLQTELTRLVRARCDWLLLDRDLVEWDGDRAGLVHLMDQRHGIPRWSWASLPPELWMGGAP